MWWRANDWRWPAWCWSARCAAVFLVIDLAFFGANIIKVGQGGWLPLALAAVDLYDLADLEARPPHSGRAHPGRGETPGASSSWTLQSQRLARVPGTAIFMSGAASRTPPALMHNVEHNKVLHEQIIFVTVKTEQIPHVEESERLRGRAVWRRHVSREGALRVHGGAEHPAGARTGRRQGLPRIDPCRHHLFPWPRNHHLVGPRGMAHGGKSCLR